MRISDWSSDVCSSDLIANEQPRFCQAFERDPAKRDHVANRLRQNTGTAALYECPALDTLLQFDNTGNLEAAQRFPHGRAADAQLLGQFPFGRPLVARAQNAREHLAAYLIPTVQIGRA